MADLDRRTDHWNSTGSAKTFGHPLHPDQRGGHGRPSVAARPLLTKP
ncbi:hypothetical protein ACGFZP_15865 [Kitasatospora sp. NPDC048239]